MRLMNPHETNSGMGAIFLKLLPLIQQITQRDNCYICDIRDNCDNRDKPD
jgi:hypothetical protein